MNFRRAYNNTHHFYNYLDKLEKKISCFDKETATILDI